MPTAIAHYFNCDNARTIKGPMKPRSPKALFQHFFQTELPALVGLE